VLRAWNVIVPAVVAGLLSGLVPASQAGAAQTVPRPMFGQHVNSLAGAAPSTLPRVGAIRLWDTGVSWRYVEYADNRYDWSKLDRAIDNARALGASEILYVLGNPPRWAASNPRSRGALYGPGTNTHPRSNALYLDFVRALVDRYGTRITAYQVWNEANLRDFYTGSPAQLATLTKQTRDLLRRINPRAKLVAASTTVRAAGPYGPFAARYAQAMRAVRWPVDAVSAHLYPPALSGPDTRVAYIRAVKRFYARYGAGRKPLWDTEMNYGDTRSFARVKRQYRGPTAAAFVARTYIDSMRYGVQRVFWYGWVSHALGVDMTTRDGRYRLSTGGRAFLEIQDWMAGASWRGCTQRGALTTCTLVRNGRIQSIRYATGSRTVVVPRRATRLERLDGTTTRVRPGQRIRLTSQPVLLVGA